MNFSLISLKWDVWGPELGPSSGRIECKGTRKILIYAFQLWREIQTIMDKDDTVKIKKKNCDTGNRRKLELDVGKNS